MISFYFRCEAVQVMQIWLFSDPTNLLQSLGFEMRIKGRRSVTPDTALRLSRVLGLSADFWLGLQQEWDLWHAMNSPEAKQISRLKPISRDMHSFA